MSVGAGLEERITSGAPRPGARSRLAIGPREWPEGQEADLLGAGMPGATTYRFKKTGARLSGGKQMDLWNAVQSLLE